VDSRLEALRRASERLPPGAAFSGLTAAWLLGLEPQPGDVVEATAPADSGISTRAEMRIRRANLGRCDVVAARGLPTTSALRTLRDLCLRFSLTESVVFADTALHKRLITVADLAQWAKTSLNHHGVKRLRTVLRYVEPKAASPMETRLRMRVVLARLPRPEPQVPIYDGHRFLGRPDLYYRDARLGLEYDGATHKNSVLEDNRRQNLLIGAGVRLLRFTASDIYNSPDVVVAQVRSALRAAS